MNEIERWWLIQDADDEDADPHLIWEVKEVEEARRIGGYHIAGPFESVEDIKGVVNALTRIAGGLPGADCQAVASRALGALGVHPGRETTG